MKEPNTECIAVLQLANHGGTPERRNSRQPAIGRYLLAARRYQRGSALTQIFASMDEKALVPGGAELVQNRPFS